MKSAVYRPLFRKEFWVFLAVCIGLGYLGAQPAEGAYLWFARLFSTYYFLHFLVILPILGKIEKPEPVPKSIEASIVRREASHV